MKLTAKLKKKLKTGLSWLKSCYRKPKRRKKLFRFLAVLLFVWSFWEYYWLPDCKELINHNPQVTPLMELRREQAASQVITLKVNYKWVPINQMPPSLIRAVIAGEDFDFFTHDGFDWSEMGSAFLDIFRKFRFPRGASTITQQLAKNLYLSPSRNPIRKIKEAIITNRLERLLTKKRILELYLNVIELGDGIFGVGAASEYYFKRPVQSIGAREAAFLAAIIPAPRTTYSPKKHAQRVANRQNILLKRMEKVKLPSTIAVSVQGGSFTYANQ
jgi:monofunctional glycosyltransferase